MAQRKKITFHDRVGAAVKELDEKIEVSEKDILRESAKLYRCLYEETVKASGVSEGGANGSKPVTEIELD